MLAKERLADGSKGRLGVARDEQDWRDTQQVTTRCAACRRVHRGTAAEGREWARAHREERHPELANRPRVRMTAKAQRAKAMRDSEWKRERFGSAA